MSTPSDRRDRRSRDLNAGDIDELLLAREWSWRRLADESGVSYRAIRYGLDPDEPRPVRHQTAQRIAAALGTTYDQISTLHRQPADVAK